MKSSRLLLIIATCLIALNACTAAIVGGAAAGTAYVVTDDRTAGEIASDIGITSSIKTKFFTDSGVDALDINVDTFRGEVTLYGNVPSEKTKERAILLASGVKGVKKIISRLVIVPPAD